mmetsp:Transcript_94936/g.186269  ORF Transcript_94936/g.186269 Transcript_94936/m.186269 type:complete len:98 (-) Transcript_94936:68-361(-)
MWTCKLCSQAKNPVDVKICKTCGRARGHNPEGYRKHLAEIRKWNAQAGGEEVEETFTLSDSWGLICGLILMFLIIGVLTWAYLEDQKDAAMLENQEL